MPHATEDEVMADVDENAATTDFLTRFGGEFPGGGVDDGHDFDQGDKDDDAVDFGDISDEDDLPEEEEATNYAGADEEGNPTYEQGTSQFGGLPVQPPRTNGYHADQDVKEHHSGDLFGESDEAHDLFGERSSSPEQQRSRPASHAHPPPQRPGGLALPSKSSLALPGFNRISQPTQARQVQRSAASKSPPSTYRRDEYSPAASETDSEESLDEAQLAAHLAKMEPAKRAEFIQTREQRKMFDLAARKRKGEYVDEGPEEIDMELFYTVFPDFEKNQNPNFVKLFPPRPATYRGKIPLKPPRPVPPTKLSLDLLADQEKSFRTPDFGNKGVDGRLQREGFVVFNRRSEEVEDSDDDLALSIIDENERIGGVTMQDLAVICGDWDLPSSDLASVASDEDVLVDGEWEAEERVRPRKKQRTNFLDSDFSLSIHDPQLPFEDPERATARLAKRVALDLNDPNLLLDELVPQHRRSNVRESRRDRPSNKITARRYNISNDEQYELLKENHQHKVRSTLGAMALEHSLPATRLQYPFYKIALDSKAKRSFHRPQLDVRDGRGREWRFQKQKHIKRKHLRGREAKDIFAKAEDLYLGDNANVILMEYSEEAPLMLSNFGMGNRLINYYRKRDAEDQERPKREIGETQVLLTQDKSPFSNFGHVEKGEIVPTVQNGMYRAPVFQHKPKSTDFLVGLSSTYQSGHRFYLRNIENLLTVGQQFPITEVPGEHSRKVTDAAKKRLRALSYRMYSKSVDPTRPRAKPLNNENLMPHLPGHDMPQTRSKMREFMKYERAPGKDSGGIWVPPPGSVVPDAETLRSWIKPEEICVLDSMQVGVQHLGDLGMQDSKNQDDEQLKDLDESASIELQLAPWRTTKNFLAACQGKAMLKLHGEGDPTGRGEGFSFVKTSMKGGFTALGESVEDKIEAKKRRETSGHSYNVAKQQKAYDDSIRIIWNKQKESLSNAQEGSDTEMEDDVDEPQSAYPAIRGATPRSSFGTPAALARHDDESASQFSRGSIDRGDKVLTITRMTRDKYGKPTTTYEKVTNPRVIQLYRKKRMEKEIQAIKSVPSFLPLSNILSKLTFLTHSIMEMNPTGDPEKDALRKQKLEAEFARISRNMDRRVAREKAKGKPNASPAGAGSPNAPSDADGTGNDGTPQKGRKGNKDGTARKCANCGQVGHIKTNRKSVSVTFLCLVCQCTQFDPQPVDLGKGGPRSAVQAARRSSPVAAAQDSTSFLKQSYSQFTL